MDRRTFMKLLGGLASMPIVGRIAKPLKSETVQEGIASVSEGGMKLYEMVVAKVLKEGTKVKESGRVDSYKHPDRPDITVDVNQTDGSAEIYFDTDRGSKGYAEIRRDMETGGDDLIEAEEVFNMRGDKDIEEGISGGIENLEEFTRLKKAGGGEVNLTIVRMPDINESGVESLFKTR
jgi:predicted dehydrogenase